jgi:hypothetical protein
MRGLAQIQAIIKLPVPGSVVLEEYLVLLALPWTFYFG